HRHGPRPGHPPGHPGRGPGRPAGARRLPGSGLMALLEIQAVRAGYGNGPDILTDVSLDVAQRKTYCIIRPNGAGKSALLKTVAGLLTPREGDIVFDGTSIAGRRPDQVLQAGVCFVPQDRTIFPQMSVRENL